MTQKKIVVDDLLLTYIESGNADRMVLLLHGWGDTAETFKALMTVLDKNYKTVALNLPGFGGSDNPPSTWGLLDYAEIVKKFVSKLGVDLFCLIGHSNGGAIAIRSVGNSLLSPQRLVLLSSSGVRDVYKGKKRVLRIAAKTAKMITYPLPKKTRERLKRSAYSSIGSDLFVAEHLQETFKKVVTDDVCGDAEKIVLPTLLIYGSEDTATPLHFGKKFASLIDGSRLEVISGAGHFVHHDSAAKVSFLVEEFLS